MQKTNNSRKFENVQSMCVCVWVEQFESCKLYKEKLDLVTLDMLTKTSKDMENHKKNFVIKAENMYEKQNQKK